MAEYGVVLAVITVALVAAFALLSRKIGVGDQQRGERHRK